MIQKKFFPIWVFLVLMLFCFNCSDSSPEQVNALPKKQIQISNFKIRPLSSSDCKVEISFLATYKNFRTGKEPKMWWQIIGDNNYSSLGFRPLGGIKENQKTIKIENERIGLAPMSSCSGVIKVYFSVEDDEVKSNEIETVCTFK